MNFLMQYPIAKHRAQRSIEIIRLQKNLKPISWSPSYNEGTVTSAR